MKVSFFIIFFNDNFLAFPELSCAIAVLRAAFPHRQSFGRRLHRPVAADASARRKEKPNG